MRARLAIIASTILGLVAQCSIACAEPAAPLGSFAGRWHWVGGDNELRALDAAIEACVKQMNIFIRGIARRVPQARLLELADCGHSPQRDQPEAVIAARQKIVHGAVSMVEMALNELSAKKVVNLDEERKAAMVSNLLVVLCGERATQPVVNTGTIYQ